jgi:CMP-N-acetylneuraminate monooxygenase
LNGKIASKQEKMNYLQSLSQQPLRYVSNERIIKKNVEELVKDIPQGSSQDENFLYYKSGINLKIFDRVCDHNGGKLSVKGANARCPLHGWELDLRSGIYSNVNCEKKPLLDINLEELDSPNISITQNIKRLCGADFDKNKTTEIRFLNHASLLFKMDGISFATDPWIIGSAFCNGWWLAKKSPKDAFDEINKCDFIYISHNHPDHLHKDSLKKIRKSMPILTANCLSRSTEKLLFESGFTNIMAMDFVTELTDLKKQLSFSVLKSGDFRDDSGLFIQHGRFKCLLTVDSHFLNFGNLPKVDLLGSSFAGGSTGFPICFDNYTEKDKEPIITRNRRAYKVTNSANIISTGAKYFLPYAGFFVEKAKRDSYVKELNKKNSVEDYKDVCDINNCNLLNLNAHQKFIFNGCKLESRILDETEKMSDPIIEDCITSRFKNNKIDLQIDTLKYFSACNFNDNLIVDLIASNDDFSLYFDRFLLDFDSNEYKSIDINSDNNKIENDALSSGSRYLQIKVRASELAVVLKEGKPWEDLSIGFQCRIYRQPNIYNSEFWFYFTNIYIGNTAAVG